MKTLYKILKWTGGIFFGLAIVLTLVTILYMRKEVFGSAPEGARLEAMKKSPNFKDGHFQNIHETPELTEGVTMTELLWEFFFQDKPRRYPVDTIPSMKTDLLALPLNQDVLVWFGHS